MKVKITAQAKLPAVAGRQTDYWDASLPGFGQRVGPTGSRSWVVMVRVGGRKRRVSLGTAPPVSLLQARRRAREILSDAALGRDPLAPRGEATLQQVAGLYIDDRAPQLRGRTEYNYRRLAAGMLGQRLLPAEAPRREVSELFDRLAREHGPVAANRAFQLARAACRWAIREGRLERNPFEGLRRPRREESRERVLSPDEVVALWKASEAARPGARALVRCLLLLGQRATETARMRWADLQAHEDGTSTSWMIPGSTRKGGAPHALLLPAPVVEMLQALPRKGASVFRCDPKNWMRWWGPIVEAAGLRGDVTRHDLRRTCATGCAQAGASREVVARILGHTSGAGATQVYDRWSRMPEVGAALAAWAARVLALVGTAKVPDSSGAAGPGGAQAGGNGHTRDGLSPNVGAGGTLVE